MSDYIKREDAIKAVADRYWHGTMCECEAFAHKALDGVKAADVAPVRHGRWIEHQGYCECNKCECLTTSDFKFCPNCGARMDERSEEDG